MSKYSALSPLYSVIQTHKINLHGTFPRATVKVYRGPNPEVVVAKKAYTAWTLLLRNFQQKSTATEIRY